MKRCLKAALCPYILTMLLEILHSSFCLSSHQMVASCITTDYAVVHCNLLFLLEPSILGLSHCTFSTVWLKYFGHLLPLSNYQKLLLFLRVVSLSSFASGNTTTLFKVWSATILTTVTNTPTSSAHLIRCTSCG